MTSLTQPIAQFSAVPVKLPPGHLEPVEELPGDSDLEDEESESSGPASNAGHSDIEDGDNEYEAGAEEDSLRERDPVFEKIKETVSKTQRSGSLTSDLSFISDTSDSPQVQTSQHYSSVPYGIQPRATYEHSSLHADIMGGE